MERTHSHSCRPCDKNPGDFLGTSHDKNGVTGKSLMKAILMQESVICG